MAFIRSRHLTVLPTLMLVVAACGGGSSGNTTSTGGAGGESGTTSATTTSTSSSTGSGTGGSAGTSSSSTSSGTGGSTSSSSSSSSSGSASCTGNMPLAVNGYEFDGETGTANFLLAYDVMSMPANWQMSGRNTSSALGFGLGIQFMAKPTAAKTYQVQDYGVVMDPDKAFVYVSLVKGSSFNNFNGIAGGCIDVTIENGKVVAAFRDLKVVDKNNVEKTVSMTLLEQ